MTYRILTAATPDDLAAMVNKTLSEGWALQGGLAISMPSSVRLDVLPGAGLQGNLLLFAQAIIK